MLPVETIDSIIKPICGSDEDLYQEVWEKLLKEKPEGIHRIEDIANTQKRRALSNSIGDRYRNICLDKPLTQSNDNFTLKDIIAAPEETLSPPGDYKQNGHRNLKGNVALRLTPAEVIVLQRKYPNMPLNAAVRTNLGFYVSPRQECWQPWEDDILRERYPAGGSLAVMVDVNRTLAAIRERARTLNVKLGVYRPISTWLMAREVAAILSCDYTQVLIWVNNGMMNYKKALRKGRGYFVFIEPDDLRIFLTNQTFRYNHWMVNEEWRKYIPVELWDWITLKQAQIKYKRSRGFFERGIHHGYFKAIKGYKRNLFINIPEIERQLQTPIRLSIKQPYPVITIGKRSHYMIKRVFFHYCHINGSRYKLYGYLTYCCPNRMPKLYLLRKHQRSYPTCKKCASLMRRNQAETLKKCLKTQRC
jgi:hypothetical protein